MHKNIVLGITGSIAAYKSPDLVRRLKEYGFDVRVVMTQSALQFITPLTLQAASGHKVVYNLLDPEHEAGMGHIELAKWADLILIAPATANIIAKLSMGMADDLLSTICLARNPDTTKIAIAPAMNMHMWRNKLVQNNVTTLLADQFLILGPAAGEQACGDIGDGRMLEPLEIRDAVCELLVGITGAGIEDKTLNSLKNLKNLSGKTVLLTAGPTQEAIDPVRFITNRSSGKMGYALAIACLNAGAKVILVSGPVTINLPKGITTHQVNSALEMHERVFSLVKQCDIFIATAAVADYRMANAFTQKMKKEPNQDHLNLTLIKNPDILSEVSHLLENRPFCIGFAAETENIIQHGLNKMNQKQLDMICINDVSSGQVFESEYNMVHVFSKNNTKATLNHAPKQHIADQIVAIIADEFASIAK